SLPGSLSCKPGKLSSCQSILSVGRLDPSPGFRFRRKSSLSRCNDRVQIGRAGGPRLNSARKRNTTAAVLRFTTFAFSQAAAFCLELLGWAVLANPGDRQSCLPNRDKCSTRGLRHRV